MACKYFFIFIWEFVFLFLYFNFWIKSSIQNCFPIIFFISLFIYTHTPCGFLLVGTAFSNCRGDPINFRVVMGLGAPINKENKYK